MHSLPLFIKLSGRNVVLVGSGEAAKAKARLIERAGGIIITEDEAGDGENAARLAFVALEDEEQAKQVATRLKARGMLVNVVDRPQLCDFTTPAIIDRSPVLIAIATGGASAGLAKALRQRLEALLPAPLGTLAEALKSARQKIRRRWPEAADRRRAIDSALSPGNMLDPLAGYPDIDRRVERWLSASHEPASRRVEEIIVCSADPDELTLRAARLLGEADHIVHSEDCPPHILDRARADAARHPLPCDWNEYDGMIILLEYAG